MLPSMLRDLAETIDLFHVYIFCSELTHAQRLAGKNMNITSRRAKIRKYLLVIKMSDFKGKNYLSILDDNSRDLYMKKLQLADNSQLPNPYDDLLGWKMKFLYYQTYPGLIFTTTILITLAVYLQMNHWRPTNPSMHTIISSRVTSRKYTIMKLKKTASSASSNQK